MFTFMFRLLLWALFVYCLQRSIKYCINHYKLYCALKHFPGPPITNPFTGHLNLFWNILINNPIDQYGTKLNELLHQLCDKYGTPEGRGKIRLWHGLFTPWLIEYDFRNVNKIISHPDYIARARNMEIHRAIAGKEFYTMAGQKSIKERHKLTKFFKTKSVDTYISVMKSHLEAFNRRVSFYIEEHDGKCFDMERLISNFSLDCLGENIFATQYDAQNGTDEEAKVTTTMNSIMEMMGVLLLTPWNYCLPFPRSIAQILILAPVAMFWIKPFLYAKYFVWKTVRDRIKQVTNKLKFGFSEETTVNKGQIAMLDTLIQSTILNLPDKVENIVATTASFVVAGVHTTTVAISWISYMLAHHSDEQLRCQAEVDKYLLYLQSTDDQMSYSNLKHLKYLDSCIKESLRLFSPVPLVGRRGRAPLLLDDGYTLPTNVNVFLFFQRMHRDERYFKNANSFYPDRFLYPSTNDQDVWCTAQAFLPFGGGLRSCVAKEYAIVLLKLFFVNLLSKFEMTALDNVGDCKPKFTTLESSAHFPVLFKHRN